MQSVQYHLCQVFANNWSKGRQKWDGLTSNCIQQKKFTLPGFSLFTVDSTEPPFRSAMKTPLVLSSGFSTCSSSRGVYWNWEYAVRHVVSPSPVRTLVGCATATPPHRTGSLQNHNLDWPITPPRLTTSSRTLFTRKRPNLVETWGCCLRYSLHPRDDAYHSLSLVSVRLASPAPRLFTPLRSHSFAAIFDSVSPGHNPSAHGEG
ncbi:uncharacterized protein BP01DRAFT_134932 [Aspergillus saccharolyticus JOP 1030-1]|uniref:Uncharacterized protein n=1 Tax=Aspergillus saccharolyticus JOP 1030-1 TaxID=1450539 RepID=A0A319A4M0_9EURO|nr:hypothetical protein BP01DRAFT_134932 [Aspergillus saccharolyticus JOP 1030-1]PYH42382.1 hypothetical protein BP01DRAFT_134932 [Aspergillus saccharolyticus JOP 1030-1]